MLTNKPINNMKTPEEIAQWVIDNRYPKSENDKVSDHEMYHTLVDSIKAVNIAVGSVIGSLQREELAKGILLALLQNPERYKYIATQVESGKLKQEDANRKNVNKAYKIADSFLSVGNNDL